MSDAQNRNTLRLQLLERINQEFEAFKKALAPATDPISALLRISARHPRILRENLWSWSVVSQSFSPS